MKKKLLCKLGSSGICWLSISLQLAFIDQATKRLVATYVPLNHSVYISKYISISHVANKGVAFSLLSEGGQQVFDLIIVINVLLVGALVKWLYQSKVDKYQHNIGLALIISGALGNLCDRLSQGYVTDFIDFHYGYLHWPAFNIADSLIFLGVLLTFFCEKKTSRLDLKKA